MGLLIVVIIVLPIVLGIIIGVNRANKSKENGASFEDELKRNNFSIDKKCGILPDNMLYVDNQHKSWSVSEKGINKPKIYKFSELIDFELIEDENSKVKGGFGKALVGGALGGTTGAVIGSAASRNVKTNVKNMEIQIRTNDFDKMNYSIHFIYQDPYGVSKGIPKNSIAYTDASKKANEAVAALTYISNDGNMTSTEAIEDQEGVSDDIIDTIKKLNDLKNNGIISDEEFQTKKKELMTKL